MSQFVSDTIFVFALYISLTIFTSQYIVREYGEYILGKKQTANTFAKRLMFYFSVLFPEFFFGPFIAYDDLKKEIDEEISESLLVMGGMASFFFGFVGLFAGMILPQVEVFEAVSMAMVVPFIIASVTIFAIYFYAFVRFVQGKEI